MKERNKKWNNIENNNEIMKIMIIMSKEIMKGKMK